MGSSAQLLIEQALLGAGVEGPVIEFVEFVKGCLKTRVRKEDLWRLRSPDESSVQVSIGDGSVGRSRFLRGRDVSCAFA